MGDARVGGEQVGIFGFANQFPPTAIPDGLPEKRVSVFPIGAREGSGVHRRAIALQVHFSLIP